MKETPDLVSIIRAGLPDVDQNQFLDALRQTPGSSFRLGDDTAAWEGLGLIRDESRTGEAETSTREMVYENDKGLRVTRVFTFYPGYEAVEHKTHFENVGDQDLPPLSRISAMDLWYPFSAFERLVIHTTGVGDQEAAHPCQFWTLNKYYLLKDSGSGIPYSSWNMSSGKEAADRGAHRPMALLADEDSGDGMFIELGWTGFWQIRFWWTDFKVPLYCLPPSGATEHPDTIRIEGEVPGVNIVLHPGERISSPTVLQGFYAGGVRQGSNRLRRLKLKHFCLPWPEGVPESATIYDDFFTSRGKVPEDQQRELVDLAADLGIEYFFALGADWSPEMRMWGPYERYESPTEPWSYPVDRAILPSGSLRGLADYIHSKGMKFGMWMDPERAYDHWPVVQEHPDWVMYEPTSGAGGDRSQYIPGERIELPDPCGADRDTFRENVFNFGIPEVIDWVESQMSRTLEAWDVDFYFHDRFGAPHDFWQQLDPPDRQGMTQMAYIEGRYELWRRLHARFPNMLILNPGGLDLECMRYSHITMAGRHAGDGNYSRLELSGLNWFYPTGRIQNDFIMYKDNDAYKEPYPLSAWLSRFPAMFGLGDPLPLWSPAVTDQAKRVIEVYKQIRHLNKGDFYPLLPQARSMETWDGWQYHQPETGEGVAVVFRLRYCDQETETIRLGGLEADVSYRFQDPFGDESFTMSGRELMTDGFSRALPANGAQLLHYLPAGS